MKSIKVNLKERSYNIFIGKKSVDNLKDLLNEIKDISQIAIISTPPVADLYLQTILQNISKEYKVKSYLVPDGEIYKSLDQAEKIYSWLIENNFDRQSLIIGLGGGVIGDLSGFVAATFMRGIRLVHIPTTLLAQVDSSIGGKVGVNHQLGKNLIGAFWQPEFVLINVEFLKTLNDEEFLCGMGEVVKYSLIIQSELYKMLEENIEKLNKDSTDLVEKIVLMCAKFKADIVAQDEREGGIRAILNFGHTFGHSLESFYGYKKLKHGQAVILGMKCAVNVSENLNFIGRDNAQLIYEFIDKFNVKIPSKLSEADIKKLIELMKHDKKVTTNEINFILIRKTGEVFKTVISDMKQISYAFNSLN